MTSAVGEQQGRDQPGPVLAGRAVDHHRPLGGAGDRRHDLGHEPTEPVQHPQIVLGQGEGIRREGRRRIGEGHIGVGDPVVARLGEGIGAVGQLVRQPQVDDRPDPVVGQGGPSGLGKRRRAVGAKRPTASPVSPSRSQLLGAIRPGRDPPRSGFGSRRSLPPGYDRGRYLIEQTEPASGRIRRPTSGRCRLGRRRRPAKRVLAGSPTNTRSRTPT